LSHRVIAASIIVGVRDSSTEPSKGPTRTRTEASATSAAHTAAQDEHDQLVGFYDDSYARTGEQAELYSRWRALGARGKADHVIALCARAGIEPASTLEVGCGDGALLCELHKRGFGGKLYGVEITQAAVDIARERSEIDSVELYDGRHLGNTDGTHDVGVVSHVLEHVPEPAALLAEVGRVCGAVVMEVPLEDNLSAKRASKREHAEEVGHLRSLSRESARAIARDAGMRVVGELEDPLALEVHRFFASTTRAQGGATAKWIARTTAHRLAPALARRLFTVHYACLCVADA
jgi:ubiquinone/menaquinone biosynthesis C-methylase UbiE